MGQAFCPVCRTELFPIFRLDMADPRVHQIVTWPLPALELPVCPGCVFFHQDYYIDFSQTPFTVFTPHLAGEEKPLLAIKTPYETRRVTLRQLEAHEYPGSDELCKYEGHQIGGIPPRWFSNYKDNSCFRCCRPMKYASVVHYDDGNVPLFDADGDPVQFSLGDLKSYYVFTCAKCLVLSFRFAM